MKLLFTLIGTIIIFGIALKHIENLEVEMEYLKKENSQSFKKGEAIGRYALYLHLKETKQIKDSIFVDIKRWNNICDSLEVN